MGGAKHIEMRFLFLRELVSKGRLRSIYCRSEAKVADLFTKGLTIEMFRVLKMNTSMEDLNYIGVLSEN